MKVVDFYLARAMLGATMMVLAVLLALGGFIEFVGQLDDVGTGDYGILQGLAYAAMKTPEMAFIMLPMAVLLGCLLGFGTLASGSEMIALRAAGMSPLALARSVLWAGLVASVVGLVLGFYLAPPAERFSRQYRTFAMHGPSGIAGTQSSWVRDGDTIINMSRLGDPSRFGGVYLFRLAVGGDRLASVARADSAGTGTGDDWVLNNFAETSFEETGMVARRERQFAELTGLNPELVALTVVRPEALDGAALWRYIGYLRENGLDPRRYEAALWSRMASAVAVAPMCVLALAFSFGQLRRAGTGARMLIGIVIGLAYFLVSRGLADGGEIYDINPLLTGWLPTLLLAAATASALARVR